MEKDTRQAEIGKKLQAMRGRRPRREVAEKLGISESALAMYEAGERSPRDPIKIRIADYYHSEVSELFF